nr:hypothetical protein [Pseudodesulfovibrio sp.]
MNAAFSVWEDRIAPVFDVTTELVIVAQNPDRTGIKRVSVQDNSPSTLIATLLGRHVSVLVCGAISRPLHNAVTARNIVVHPFIRGGLAKVINAWRTGDLEDERFRMPGCGNRQGRCHGNQETLPGQRGTGRMNRFGRRHGARPFTSMTEGSNSRKTSDTASRQQPLCRCLRCGLIMPHVPGVPCTEHLCPNCHIPMVRA